MARATATGPKARNDAYTGLLAISFLALVGASVMMYLDADKLGKPPEKLKIDVPGVTAGKAGEGLKRPDTGRIDTDAPKGPDKKDGGVGMNLEPNKLPALPPLPPLPIVAAGASAIVPVKAEEPVEGPPLPVKPFVPPM